MTRRLRIWVVCLSVLMPLLVSGALVDPIFKDVKLSKWLKGYDSEDEAERRKVDEVVCRLGEEALIYVLDESRPHVGPDMQKRLARASAALEALRAGADLVEMAKTIYKNANGPDAWQRQLMIIRGIQVIESPLKRCVPLVVQATANPNAKVRSQAYRALGCLPELSDPVLELLEKGLNDPDIEVRSFAARALSEYGPAGQKHLPRVVRLFDESRRRIAQKPEDERVKAEYRNSLRAVRNLSETKDDWEEKKRISAMLQENPQLNFRISDAYRHVMLALMLEDANEIATALDLPCKLPILRRDLTYVASFSPYLAEAGGCIDNRTFSFSFDETGRMSYLTRLNFFGSEGWTNAFKRLANVPSHMGTNDAYQLATNWLSKFYVDVKALEQRETWVARRQRFFDSELPIWDVIWGDPHAPLVSVRIYGPTTQLIEIRVHDNTLSVKPRRALKAKDFEKLLAITDEDFARYSVEQRSNLVYEAKASLPRK